MFPEVNYILQALSLLPPTASFRIANQVRPADSYLFAQFLPEIGKPSYDAQSGNMTVNAVMAGLAGLSSNYPPGGFISASTTSEKTAKIANHVELQEEDLRLLQAMVQNAIAGGARGAVLIQYVLEVVLNFFDKLVLQPHLDTIEFLRGQALCEGAIDWWNHGIHLTADYHIPDANKNATRTGNDAYDGNASKFWADLRFLQSRLNQQMRACVMHPETFDVAAGNPVNGINILDQTDNMVTIQRIIETTGGAQRLATDVREKAVRIWLYGLEATKVDDTNPRKTVNVPFIRRGRMLGVGQPPANRFDVGRFAVGQGATPDPSLFVPLGYTHIAPTVEGGGQIGRWGRVFTPQERPWAVAGEGVTNAIPVIDSPLQVATCMTAMP